MPLPVIKNISANLLDLYGFRSGQKYVVFDSDDWGAIRMPSLAALQRLGRYDQRVQTNKYLLNDTLASPDDLTHLFEVLRKHQDAAGCYPVFTFNTVMANPDFEKIAKTDFKEYFHEPFYHTITREYGADVLLLWQQGIDEGLIKPQLHCREHVHVLFWLEELRKGNKLLRKAFEERCYGIPCTPISHVRVPNLQQALDRKGFENEKLFQQQSLQEAANSFEEYFGFTAKSFVYPNYHWHRELDLDLSRLGVSYIKGMRLQSENDPEHGYSKRILHYTGKRNALGQYHIVRNAFFEPTLDDRDRNLDKLLNRIQMVLRMTGVAVIGTHRLNYIGALNNENRERNLHLLDELLGNIVRRWPDVIFISSDQLGDVIRRKKEAGNN